MQQNVSKFLLQQIDHCDKKTWIVTRGGNQMPRDGTTQNVIPFFRFQKQEFPLDLDQLTPLEKLSLEKEKLMIAILDTITDGVMTINFNMQITSFNRAAERITGFTAQEAIGKQCMDIFCNSPNFDQSECFSDCSMKLAVSEGKPITRKKTVVNKKGELITISSTASILNDLNGNPIGGMATFVDITAFERLKEECEGENIFWGTSLEEVRR